jgi:hypothetical protein
MRSDDLRVIDVLRQEPGLDRGWKDTINSASDGKS